MNGQIVGKGFSSYQVNDALLAKVVDAIRKGEADARRYSQLHSFEIYYEGFRERLVLGRIIIVPAKLADSPEDFPSALLYGALVKEIRPEDLADLYSYKLGESEFDEYDTKGLSEIKEKLFKDENGVYRSIILFIPTWANVRDYVIFKMTRDWDRLTEMVRHLVFAAYFDPRYSSTFNHLSNDTDNLNVAEINPKLNFPGLAQGQEQNFPNLEPGDGGVKTASATKPRMLLAADTVDKIDEVFLEKGERAVIDHLAEELKERVNGEIATPTEAADKKASPKRAANYGWSLGQQEDGQYRWSITRNGMLNKNKILIQGTAPTREEAQAALDAALRDVGAKPPSADENFTRAPHFAKGKEALSPPLHHYIWKPESQGGSTCRWCAKKWQDRETACVPHDQPYLDRNDPEYKANKQQRQPVTAAKKTAIANEHREQLFHEFLRKYQAANGGLTPDRLYLDGQTGAVGTERPQHDDYYTTPAAHLFESKQASDRDVEHEQVSQSTDEELAARRAEIEAHATVLKGVKTYAPRELRELQKIKSEQYLRSKGEASVPHVTAIPPRAVSAAKQASDRPVIAVEGGKLNVSGAKFVVKAASGHTETLRINGKRVKWARPLQFTAAFRAAVETYVRNPTHHKKADVPQTFESIWAEIAEPMGPAPAVELKGVPKTDGSSSESAPAARTQKQTERRDPEKKGDRPFSEAVERVNSKNESAKKDETTEDQKKEESKQASDLVEAVRDYALQHYNEGGWDTVIETMERSDIQGVIGDAKTPQEAVQRMAAHIKPFASFRDDIRGEADFDRYGNDKLASKQKEAAGPLGLTVDKKIQTPHAFSPFDGHSNGRGPGESEQNCRTCGKGFAEGNHGGKRASEGKEAGVLDMHIPDLGYRRDPKEHQQDLNGVWVGGYFPLRSNPKIVAQVRGLRDEDKTIDFNLFDRSKTNEVGSPRVPKQNLLDKAVDLVGFDAGRRRMKQDKFVEKFDVENGSPTIKSASLGKCASCTKPVTASDGSEVAPSHFLHRACQEKAKAAAFNMYIPGQVIKEFYPELQGESTEFPGGSVGGGDGYDPAIGLPGNSPTGVQQSADGLPAPGDQYVSTKPSAAMGLGRDGKPQILEGAPLRQENDIRGYQFDQEYYGQQRNLSPRAFVAAYAVERVAKTANVEEFQAQFSDFLKKAMGEIAASFIAAFKVTLRPPMNKVPGTGELRLDEVERSSTPLPPGATDIASRVRVLVDKLTDSQIQDAINGAWSQAAVWNEDARGGYTYEVFIRPASIDKTTMVLKYEFVVGTKGL